MLFRSIILDCWTGDEHDRRGLIACMRQIGATRVVALYFITPPGVVEDWFWKKAGVVKASERGKRPEKDLAFYPSNAPRTDYRRFHKLARSISKNGFDKVIKIDPRKELVVLPWSTRISQPSTKAK